MNGRQGIIRFGNNENPSFYFFNEDPSNSNIPFVLF